MHAVVMPLPEPLDSRIRQVWSALRERFGLSVAITQPHLSLHVAEEYAFDVLPAVLSSLSATGEPLETTITGLGLFQQPDAAVIYLAVTRTPGLSRWHDRVYGALQTLAARPHPLYTPEHWTPHITLLEHAPLALTGRLLDWLLAGDAWTGDVRLDRLGLMRDTGQGHSTEFVYPLRGLSSPERPA